MHNYFYRDKEGREIGPFDLATLAKFRTAGVLEGGTPVRTADSVEWKPCREFIADPSDAPGPLAVLQGTAATSSKLGAAQPKWIVGAVILVAIILFLNKKEGSDKIVLTTGAPISADSSRQKAASDRGLLQVIKDTVTTVPPVPVPTEKGWGYIHQSGSIAIQPAFWRADYFSEGLARVEIPSDTNIPSSNPSYGFIDSSGKVVFRVTTTTFANFGSFSQSRAFVVVRANFTEEEKAKELKKWESSISNGLVTRADAERNIETVGKERVGYVDPKGHMVIAAQYDPIDIIGDRAFDFHEGLVFVKQGTNRMYIDPSGKVVIRLPSVEQTSALTIEFKGSYDFSGGLAPLLTTKADTQYGRDGKEYRFVNPFYGYVDHSGATMIRPSFTMASPFSDGFAIVFSMGNYCSEAFVDQSGKSVFNIDNCAEIKRFSEGLAPIRKVGERFCYINKSGQAVLKTAGIEAYPFSNGLAIIQTESGVGFIDKTGKYIITPQFDSANDFRDGLATVSLNGEEEFINPEGKVVYSVPRRRNSTTQKPLPSCADNLRLIEQAKEQWLTLQMYDIKEMKDKEFVRTNGVPDLADLKLYLRHQYPKCPDGGVYNIGPKGTPPSCSIHGALVQ